MDKVKFTIEFPMMSTPRHLLWQYISTQAGLGQWYADEVEQNGKQFTFIWDGAEQGATLIASRANVFVRFRNEEDDEAAPEAYFEMRILTSELTGETMLRITDFADSDDEVQEMRDLWTQEVELLRRCLGVSY